MKKKTLTALLLACIMLMSSVSAAWSPVDFAGGSLSGIVADGDDLLVSDVFNNVVWRITDKGVEQAVGQIGIPGLDGEPIGKYDDGTLETALFMEPWAMTPFLEGFAITDTDAHVVRYFNDKGVFTAVGSGKAGSSDGTGTGASFDTPTGLATGADGEVYIADTGNGAIRVMSVTGQVTTLVTGLVDPTGLCVSGDELYVAETGNHRIISVNVNTKKITVIAGGDEGYADGLVKNARFCNPQGVAVGEDGSVYVADTVNHAVRKIKDGKVTTLAVSRETPDAPVQPRGILVKDGKLYVTDLFAQTVLELDLKPVSYKDVPAGHWAEEYVVAASEFGITTGTGNGMFSPGGTVTRAMLVVMLSRLHQNADGNAVIAGDAAFPDVAESMWCADEISWAADLGLINGYEDGNFGPNDPVTRQQLVAILYRYAVAMEYDVSVGEDTNILSYSDATELSEYAFPAMQWACGEGVVSGYTDGSLKPWNQANRAQMVKILMKAMEVFEI